MRHKSDSAPLLLTATEVSRSFSKILDRVERGEHILVERHGERICMLAPPPVDGRRASACLALLGQRAPVLLDDRFGADLHGVIAGEARDVRPWDS